MMDHKRQPSESLVNTYPDLIAGMSKCDLKQPFVKSANVFSYGSTSYRDGASEISIMKPAPDLSIEGRKLRILALQKRVAEKCENNPRLKNCSLYQLLMSKDDLAKRFLRRKEWDVDRAFGQVMRALDFAIEMKLDDLKPIHFPKELQMLAPMILYKEDRNGCPMAYIR